MKHLKKILIGTAAAALLSVSVLTGCGGGPATLEGTTWEVEKMTSGGADMTGMVESLGGMTCEFKADGQLIMTVSGRTSAVQYTYNEGVLMVEGDEGQFSGDTITFTVGGDTLILKQKQ